jgi:hypothetical protein
MPTISALAAGTTIVGTEPVPGVQSGVTVKFTFNQAKTYIAPLTTKGDMLAYSTANVRVAVGSNGKYMTADSTAAPGVSWQSPTTNSLPKRGKATMTLGTVDVTEATVTANSLIFLTVVKLGTVVVPKAVAVTAITASTKFTITSADATDTSDVAWILYEPTS